MLELQKWAVKLRNPHYEFKLPHWDVLDPDTERQVGVIRQNKEAFRGFFRFRWLNAPIEARTVPDDSLVFSLYVQVRLGRNRLQVRNAERELLGYFRRKWFSLRSGFWVYDGQGRRWGEVRPDWTRYELRLLGPGGEELGTVSRKLVGLSRAVLYHERDYLVTAGGSIADRPDMKRLLLATALAAGDIPT